MNTNPRKPNPLEASGFSDGNLHANPVFDPGYTLTIDPAPLAHISGKSVSPGAPSWIISLTDPNDSIASATAQAHRDQLLSEMFPGSKHGKHGARYKVEEKT